MCTNSTTLYLKRTLGTIVCLADILIRIVVYVWITIRINARSMVVYVLLTISWLKSVISTCFIIECHVLGSTKIIRECLCYVPTGVGISFNLKTVNFATFSSDKNSTFSSLCTIEYDSLCPLEESNLLNLRRKYVV